MNTGRNWTRRSIEELIDDFLRRRGTPTPTTQPQYVNIRGKISEGKFGSAYVMLGVVGASKIMDAVDDNFLRINDLAATVDCRYSGTTPINLAFHCEKTYFPIAINLGNGGFALSLDAIYYMPWTSITTYQGTCYIITKSSSTTGSRPSIGNGEFSYSFSGSFSPVHIHSIPTSATMAMNALAFRAGRNNEYLQAMQAIDTVIRNRIVSPLGINTGTCILSEYAIPETEIQRKYPQITTFQRLTY